MGKNSLSLLKLIGIAIVAAIIATNISNAQTPLKVRNNGLVHICEPTTITIANPPIVLSTFQRARLGFGELSSNNNPHYEIGKGLYTTLISFSGYITGLYFGGYESNQNVLATYMFLNDKGLSIGYGMGGVGYTNCKLDVNGEVRSFGNVLTSDRRYKKDIKPLAEDFDKLSKLNSIKYKRSSEVLKNKLEDLKNNKEKYSEAEAKEHYEMMFASLETQIQEADADTTTRFGFIAQELRELYPELVVEDNEGYLAVNYIGMIPVLVEAIKEQQNTINKQQEQINELLGKGFEKPNTAVVTSTAKLYQNNPNPFSENTEIKYYIPENASSAMICIYDLVGSQIMRFDLRDKGYSSLTVRGRELKAGMYIYALLVDGKEIDNKRMILTE